MYLSLALYCLLAMQVITSEALSTINDYIVVINHQGPDSIDHHIKSLSNISIAKYVKKRFHNLEKQDVHIYTISSEHMDIINILRNHSTVEYIEKNIMYSIPKMNKNDSSDDYLSDNYDISSLNDNTSSDNETNYVIPDFAATTITTFQGSDTACTVPYSHAKYIANLRYEDIPASRTVSSLYFMYYCIIIGCITNAANLCFGQRYQA
jgi:hypothetical protein